MEPRQEIAKELMQQAPFLASISRQHPFIVPEQYFEKQERKLLQSVSDFNKAVSQSEILPVIRAPFETPEGYFDSLPEKIFSRITEQKKQGRLQKIVPIRPRTAKVRFWWAAASVAVLLTLTLFILRHEPARDVPETVTTSSTSTETDENDLIQSVAGIDEAVIVELLLQEQDAATVANSGNEYVPSLIDVSDLDAEMLDEI